jgi:signal transduction histidine kinase/DNA-binding response OmpR family regulator/ligand-binding sensor domain-containing protein
MKNKILYIILFLHIFEVDAQKITAFDRVNFGYASDHSIAYELAQDAFGSIWVATDEGLLRHNSQEAFLYNEYKGMPKSFSNKISNVFIDSKGRIWAASDEWLALFKPESNRFDEIGRNEKGSSFGYIFDIKEFDNQLIIASFNGLWAVDLRKEHVAPALIALKNTQVQNLTALPDQLILGTANESYSLQKGKATPILLGKNTITSCLSLDDGTYLTGTRQGELYIADKSLRVIKSIQNFGVPIFDIVKSEKQEYFVATDGNGVYHYSNSFATIGKYIHDPNNETSIPNNGIYDLLLTNKNQLWLASYGGGIVKSKTENEAFAWISHKVNQNQGLHHNFVRSILKTSTGDTWYGTKEGISIQKANKEWIIRPSLGGNGEKTIVLDLFEHGDDIWVGTYGQGAFKINKKTLQSTRFGPTEPENRNISLDKVYSIVVDTDGTVWFGGIGGSLTYMTLTGDKGSLPINQIRDLAVHADGSIYTAGRQGIFQIKDKKSRLINVLSDRKTYDFSTINCIFFENPQSLWVGTSGDGLVQLKLRDTIVTIQQNITIEHGLPSDVVQGIIDQNNALWVSTSRGLAQLDKAKNYKITRVIDERDGILSATFNYGSYAKLDAQTLAFGTAKGLLVMHTDKLPANANLQKLFYEGLEVLEGKDANAVKIINLYGYKADNIKLKYWQNFIRVRFAPIDHLTPEKQKYSWQLEGGNDVWSLPQVENEINFANLRSGSYKLHIKGINSSGIAGDPITLHFVIGAPWWASNLAFFIYFLMALGAAIAGYRLAKTLLKKKNADEQISFYNNVTHELKTPLSILLNKLDDHNEKGENTAEIKTTVHRLNALFDQLLNFNKVNSQYYRDQKISDINVDDHFKMIIQNFQQELDKKNIALNYENLYPHQIFYYKKDVLDKITYNIISNAIKYTGNNGTISIKLTDKNDHLVAVITDNGIGIPKDQQKDILKRYYRARNAINSQLPGTGLGLMIVKNLLDIDKGKISFVSEQGLGTSFTLELPNLQKKYIPTQEAVKPIPMIEVTAEDPRAQENFSKYKILIVEDNDELRIDMVEKLSEHFSIMAARDGQEGYEKAKSRLPDLIVTDLIMPNMDGIELCKRLQADENTNHIPLFMMTVLNDSNQKVESIKSGVNTYMTKPIDFPFLIAKINSVLEYKQKLRDQYLHETEISKASKFKDEREANFITDVEQFILDNIRNEDLAVNDLCKHVGMSRTSLYMKLTDLIDQSPQNFIISTRMNQARVLLLQGGKTVQEVAFMVGFNNPKYFSTSFKKQFRMSPSSFLKSLNPDES